MINFDFMKGSVVRSNLGGDLVEPPNLSQNRGSTEPNVRSTPIGMYIIHVDFCIFLRIPLISFGPYMVVHMHVQIVHARTRIHYVTFNKGCTSCIIPAIHPT